MLERQLPFSLDQPHQFDAITLACDLGYENFDSFVFRHTVTEASTAIKARLLLFLMEKYPEEELFIFLDPDIWVFSPLAEVESNTQFNIAVTPHHLVDEATPEGTKDNVYRTLQCGIFNLGFIALRRSHVTADFLQWWDSRLKMYCYVDFARGLFVDQKWIDLAMSFFDLHVVRHPGYNVANWNISHRHIEKRPDRLYVNGEPLRFIHFSGIDTGRDLRIFNRYVPDAENVIFQLRSDYKRQVASLDDDNLCERPWSYDFYDNGRRVSLEARFVYRNNATLLTRFPHPFGENDETFNSIGW